MNVKQLIESYEFGDFDDKPLNNLWITNLKRPKTLKTKTKKCVSFLKRLNETYDYRRITLYEYQKYDVIVFSDDINDYPEWFLFVDAFEIFKTKYALCYKGFNNIKYLASNIEQVVRYMNGL